MAAARAAAGLNLFLSVADRAPSRGVPVAVKDTICTTGLPTTCASRLLEGYVSPFEATAAARLRAAGCEVVAKANCDEFAMGASSETSAWGPPRNPWGPDRVCGGSSGGSAGAVAAGIVPLALGTDTGGSVRQPAALCGVVGLRPTWGRVSRHGLVSMASSMDVIGVCAGTPAQARWAFDAMTGPDPLDATSLPARPNPPRHRADPPPVAWAPDPADERLGVMAGPVSEAVADLESAGAEIRRLPLEGLERSLSAYYTIVYAEVSANLARYDGVRYANCSGMPPGRWRSRLGREAKRRILMGCHVLSAGYRDEVYGAAVAWRRSLAADLAERLESGPILLPAAPGEAFGIGSVGDPLEMARQDLFTTPASLAGLPAVSVPWGTGESGLPLGLQWVGPAGKDEETLGWAEWLAQAAAGRGWAKGMTAP